MSIKLEQVCSQLTKSTKDNSIIWFETSSRSGFITANSKGSIKLERNDFSDLYYLRFLDNNGFLLEDMEIDKYQVEHIGFKYLFETIRKQLYNVDQKVEDILSELGKQSNFLDIENVFPGKWKNDYKFHNNESGSEIFEIKDGKYFMQGKHWFNIKDYSINSDKTEISFLKAGLMEDQRRLRNTLKVIKLGQKYEGIETDEIDKNVQTRITYSKIS